jgi:hypothetical protein
LLHILSTIITPQTNDDHLIKILNILWYLWKARNDKRFNNKCWTARQVHHAANADFTIAQSVLQEHDHSLNDEQGDNGELAAHEPSQHDPINTNLHQPQPPLYRLDMPALLHGLRIYTGASLTPDLNILNIEMQELESSFLVPLSIII